MNECTQSSKGHAMSRAASYCFLGVGAVLGYVGSYFLQPDLLRASISLGDYLMNTRHVLGWEGAAPHWLGASESERAWFGLMAGTAIVGVWLAYISKKNRISP